MACEFRKALEAELLLQVEVFDSAVPLASHHADIVFRDLVLDRLLPRDDTSDAKRKAVLQHYFNAGFLRHIGPVTSKEDLAKACAEAILPAPIVVWRRSRWAKTSRPLREVGLIFAVGATVGQKAIHRWL
jgi:hypothetical protein